MADLETDSYHRTSIGFRSDEWVEIRRTINDSGMNASEFIHTAIALHLRDHHHFDLKQVPHLARKLHD